LAAFLGSSFFSSAAFLDDASSFLCSSTLFCLAFLFEALFFGLAGPFLAKLFCLVFLSYTLCFGLKDLFVLLCNKLSCINFF
jgi:hypothetical protein